MIDYIVDYQNNHAYANLFEHNLVELMQKGVSMEALFKSKVLQFQFDYDEWPAQNFDVTRAIAPYNKSFFKIRFGYDSVFSNFKLADLNRLKLKEQGKLKKNQEKEFKIKYTLNFLTSMSQADGSLIESIAHSEELPIYQTQLIKDVIDYKWATFAKRQ